MQEQRRTGTVIHVEKNRGYFFVLYEGRRIFCHATKWSGLEMPSINDVVTFEVGPPRKPEYQFEAINVRPIQLVDVLSGSTQASVELEKGGKDGVL